MQNSYVIFFLKGQLSVASTMFIRSSSSWIHSSLILYQFLMWEPCQSLLNNEWPYIIKNVHTQAIWNEHKKYIHYTHRLLQNHCNESKTVTVMRYSIKNPCSLMLQNKHTQTHDTPWQCVMLCEMHEWELMAVESECVAIYRTSTHQYWIV